jgi:hypothetical protein
VGFWHINNLTLKNMKTELRKEIENILETTNSIFIYKNKKSIKVETALTEVSETKLSLLKNLLPGFSKVLLVERYSMYSNSEEKPLLNIIMYF